MTEPTQAQIEAAAMKIWKCKIGEVLDVPNGSDGPMRDAVERAYKEITGQNPQFIFSGWGGELTEPERAVVENRPPLTAAAEVGPEKDMRHAFYMQGFKDALATAAEVKPKPTQAQIEAIGRALGLFASCIRSGEKWSGTCDDYNQRALKALAALTAAAAAEIKTDFVCPKCGSRGYIKDGATTITAAAAAAVGDMSEIERAKRNTPNWGISPDEAEIESLRAETETIKAATIELCAQKLNEIADRMTDAVRIVTLRNAAEDLRTLKEKPNIDPNLIYPGKDPDFVFPEE